MTYLNKTDKFMASLGVEAYRVGGSVRDELMGRKAKDADYVVRGVDLSALGATLRIASRHVDRKAVVSKLELRTGQHSGWRVSAAGLGSIEIMLPRTEIKIPVGDGNERHAFEITVDPKITLAEDALRRDFTFNAIYIPVGTAPTDFLYQDIGFHRGGKAYLDPLGGRYDLDDELIRVTHDNSFRDDPLRILRAARFQSTLGFDFDQTTRLSMIQHSESVTGLTGKGVSGTARDELCKILMGDNVALAMRTLRDTGVLAAFLPELAPMIGHDPQNSHHAYTTCEHTFVALDAAARMGCSLRVRLAILFHDSGKPEVEWVGDDGMKHFYESKDVPGSRDHAYASRDLANAAMRRLNFEAKMIRDVTTLIIKHMVPLSLKVKATKIRKWRCEIGDDMLADLFKHRLADAMGKGTVNYDDLRAIARMEEIREQAVRDGIPASAKDMKDKGLIDGHDLIEMGVPHNKIGDVLAAILHEIVSNPDRMEREWMLGRAEKLAAKL